MMELIDKNKLLGDSYCDHCIYKKSESCEEYCERMGHNIMAMRRMIEDAPVVDAVEVVRCKDCKYSLPNDGKLNYGARYCSRIYGGAKKEHPAVWDVDYCSGGKRKEVQE